MMADTVATPASTAPAPATPPSTPSSTRSSTRAESLQGLEREVSVMIRRIRRVIGERAREVHESLQPAAYLMLSFVLDEGPVRASRIVETFDIDKGAISRHVNHLLDLGLLDSAPDPEDGRASLLSISRAGRRRMSEVAAHRRAWLDARLTEFADDELADFVAGLARYNRALTTEADQPGLTES